MYIVECSDGSLYTGTTVNVEERIKCHNAGKGAKYTRSRLPVHLVYTQLMTDKGDALRREIEIKKLSVKAKRSLVAQHDQGR